MKVSLQLVPEQPAQELVAGAQVADELGFYACYSADEIYHKDAWLLLVAAAGRTERIRLGRCVAPVYLPDPTHLAQLAATLDELSGGRAEVVLGVGNLAMLEQYGVKWRSGRPDRAAARSSSRDPHAARRGRDRLPGRLLPLRGHQQRGAAGAGARSAQARCDGRAESMQLVGEIADGLHTACAYSAEALRYAVHHFRVGAERAGRAADRLDLGDSLLGAIARDPDVARRAGRILAAFYIPSMPPALLGRHGIDPDEVAPVNAAFAAGEIERALELTPDAVADRIMVAGAPEDWVRWLTRAYAPAGLNHALLFLHRPLHTQGVGAPRGRRPARSRRTGTTLRRTRPSPAALTCVPRPDGRPLPLPDACGRLRREGGDDRSGRVGSVSTRSLASPPISAAGRPLRASASPRRR